MKNILVLLLLLFSSNYAKSQKLDSLYADKVKDLDSIIESLYSVISGDKGVERDWDLFNYLFESDARLIPTQFNQTGQSRVLFMTPQDYVDRSGPWLIQNGFHEVEISRTVDQFGHIYHVFSSYEAYHSKKDESPFMTGINSIQLHFDGSRFKIVNIYWQQASQKHPLPDQYLARPNSNH